MNTQLVLQHDAEPLGCDDVRFKLTGLQEYVASVKQCLEGLGAQTPSDCPQLKKLKVSSRLDWYTAAIPAGRIGDLATGLLVKTSVTELSGQYPSVSRDTPFSTEWMNAVLYRSGMQ